MRRIRLIFNAVAYLIAVTVTVLVVFRVAHQMASGDALPSTPESAGFREYQEAKAEKRRADWELFSKLADEEASEWSEVTQDRVQAGVISWLDEGSGFELYFRRMTKEQTLQMQKNLLLLAKRWLGQRIDEYANSRRRQRRTIVEQDATRIVGMALIFGRLDGIGRGLNSGLQTFQEIQSALGDPQGILREHRVEAAIYFQAVFNRINQWRQDDGWQEIRRRTIDF